MPPRRPHSEGHGNAGGGARGRGDWGGQSLGQILSVNSHGGGGAGGEGKVGRHAVSGRRRAAGSLRPLNQQNDTWGAGTGDYDTSLF